MRKTMLLVLGAALLAGPAAADRGQAGDSANQDRGVQAARHFAVVEAALQTCEVHADMLGEITKRQELYDEPHGTLFVQNQKKALADGTGHLQHLEPLLQGDEERRLYDRVRQHMQGAQGRIGTLESSLGDVGKLRSEAQSIERACDDGQDPLDDLA